MDNGVVKSFTHNGIDCEVRRVKFYEEPFTPLYFGHENGHLCGYCKAPGEVADKLVSEYELHYFIYDIDVHGGVTYCRKRDDGCVWIGFDCAHCGDSLSKCDEDYVSLQCGLLADQLVAMKQDGSDKCQS